MEQHDASIGPKSPLYLQLRELLRSKIENGEYLPGTALPSVGELAQMYDIHRLSVRSAISALIGEGLLKSVQGKGIFVVGDKFEQDIETVGGFQQDLLSKKQRRETRVLTKALRPAGIVYGTLFDCDCNAQIYYIKQITTLDGEPLSFDEIYIPEALVPNLQNIDLGVFSLDEVFEFYGIHIAQGEQCLEITQLEPADARLLGIDARRGVLQLQCTSYDPGNRVVEFRKTYTRGDKCTFSVHYQKL